MGILRKVGIAIGIVFVGLIVLGIASNISEDKKDTMREPPEHTQKKKLETSIYGMNEFAIIRTASYPHGYNVTNAIMDKLTQPIKTHGGVSRNYVLTVTVEVTNLSEYDQTVESDTSFHLRAENGKTFEPTFFDLDIVTTAVPMPKLVYIDKGKTVPMSISFYIPDDNEEYTLIIDNGWLTFERGYIQLDKITRG